MCTCTGFLETSENAIKMEKFFVSYVMFHRNVALLPVLAKNLITKDKKFAFYWSDVGYKTLLHEVEQTDNNIRRKYRHLRCGYTKKYLMRSS